MESHNARMAEVIQIVSAIVPIDLGGQANDGDWISLKNYSRVTCLLFKDVGTGGEDPVITLEQATDVSGAGAKPLAVIETIHRKQGTLLTAEGQYVKDEQAAAATYTNGTLGEDEAIVLIDVLPEQLDIENEFDCIRMRVADPGTVGVFGSALYLMQGARTGAGDNLPSAIVD